VSDQKIPKQLEASPQAQTRIVHTCSNGIIEFNLQNYNTKEKSSHELLDIEAYIEK